MCSAREHERFSIRAGGEAAGPGPVGPGPQIPAATASQSRLTASPGTAREPLLRALRREQLRGDREGDGQAEDSRPSPLELPLHVLSQLFRHGPPALTIRIPERLLFVRPASLPIVASDKPNGSRHGDRKGAQPAQAHSHRSGGVGASCSKSSRCVPLSQPYGSSCDAIC